MSLGVASCRFRYVKLREVPEWGAGVMDVVFVLSEVRMSPSEFMEHWEQHYPNSPLVGHLLRDRYPDRWLRIHNLPESKRYADNDEEYRELLGRQNTIIGELIGQRAPCQLVLVDHGKEEGVPADLEACLHALNPEFLGTLAAEDGGLVADVPILMASLHWERKCLDTVLQAVADDVLETPLIVGLKQGCVLAPYDGGMDIIARDRATRDRLRQRYSAWLSRHPKGL